jgi:hypothetical protein
LFFKKQLWYVLQPTINIKKILPIFALSFLISTQAFADPSPGDLEKALLLGLIYIICKYGSILLFMLAFIKRYDAYDYTANNRIYIFSIIPSVIIVIELIADFEKDKVVSSFFNLNSFILLVLCSACISTYKKGKPQIKN